MKFVHIADVHIGIHFKQSSFGNISKNRRKEIKETFFRVIDYIKEENIELLLISGDLFEEKSVTMEDLKEVKYKFEQINKTTVLIIAGNHDPLTMQSVYNKIEWSKNVVILESQINLISIESLNLHIYGYSWGSKKINKPLLDRIKIKDNSKTNILLAHGEIATSSEYLPINKNKLIEKGFDYVALGHIHKPEFIKENIAYSGSLEPLDFSETGQHGFILGEINDKKKTFEFVPFAKRQFKHLSLEVTESITNEELKDQINKSLEEQSIHDLYRITLKGYRDVDIHFDEKKLKEFYEYGGWYIEFIDETQASYDLESLLKANEDNIIGMYIAELIEASKTDEIVSEALNIGLELMLNEKVKP